VIEQKREVRAVRDDEHPGNGGQEPSGDRKTAVLRAGAPYSCGSASAEAAREIRLDSGEP